MKRIRGVFDEIISPGNLWRAWLAFRRGKRNRASVLRFEQHADRHVLQLHRALAAGSYGPAGYRTHVIRHPKPRLIAAAPVRDRVVHHAIHRILAPILDRGLVEHTYACLPGRGTHRAVLAFVRALRRFRYVLLLDIRHYFLSIDHGILQGLMARKLAEPRLLDLLARIASSGDGLYRDSAVIAALALPPGFPPAGCGLAIGNLTSQWWGNHYLSALDHMMKRELVIPHAQRYMDDISLFADSEQRLVEARSRVAHWLAEERRLVLKYPEAAIRSSYETFTYLGHRVSREHVAPGHKARSRMRQRFGELAIRGTREEIERSVASYAGLWVGAQSAGHCFDARSSS